MAFEETKTFVLSKTLLGLLLVVVGVALKVAEMKFGITFGGSADDLIQAILEIVGVIVATVGRFKATKKLGV